MFYVRRDQINLQVPVEVSGQSTTTVVISYAGNQSAPVEIPVVSSAPALFTLDGSGKGIVVAIGIDGGAVNVNRPAKVGEILTLFATGYGMTNPGIGTGELAPIQAPYPQPALPVKMTIDGQPADLQFVGLAPGFAGLLQINARVPDQVRPGERIILLTVGQTASPAGTTLIIGQ